MAVQISGNDITVPRDGTFTRNVTIGGTLTYEDVTNIDSVGLITARNGIEIGARPGVAASISVDGNMIVSGISTFAGDVQLESDVSITDTIYHSGDPNTKIRFPAADTFSVETGGSERVRINSDGDLLVGRTSTIDASEVLGIKGPDSEHCTFGVTSDGTTQAGIIAFNDDDATFSGRIQYNHNGDSMQFNTAADERFRINSEGITIKNSGAGGGVAINALGTTSEYGLITANANRSNENDILLGVGGSWNGDSVAEIDFRAGDDTSNKDNGRIMFYTQENNSGGLEERLRIGSEGNLALGGTNTSAYATQAHFFLGGVADIYADTGTGSGKSLSITNNAYINSAGNWVYRATDKASNIYQYDGIIGFRTVASGTAGNTISWSEKFRIANDGTITNTGSNSAPTSGSGWGFTSDQLYLSTAGTGANYALRFYNDNGLVGSVLVNGSGVTYNTSSDYRLKENQVSISDAISKVKQLKPYTFNFKADSTTKIDGFFAHEAQEVVPHAVSGEKDDEQMQSMDYGKLTPLLTAALQEAISEIETLKTEVAALKSQLNN